MISKKKNVKKGKKLLNINIDFLKNLEKTIDIVIITSYVYSIIWIVKFICLNFARFFLEI